jgi:hypothetical protein
MTCHRVFYIPPAFPLRPQRRLYLLLTLLAVLCLAGYVALERTSKARGAGFAAAASTRVTQGALQVVDPEKGVARECPLKHTDVKAEISGFISRAVVTQEFETRFRKWVTTEKRKASSFELAFLFVRRR